VAEKKTKNIAKFREVLDVALMPEVVEDIKTMVSNETELIKDLRGLVEEGFALTIKPNEKKEGYSASLMQTIAGKPNAGLMVFGNGPSFIGAMACVYAKVLFLGLDSNWLDHQGQKRDTLYG
jgi:hypothetical protein